MPTVLSTFLIIAITCACESSLQCAACCCDSLLSSCAAGPNGTAWEATGVVLRITSSEELALELHASKHDTVPSHESNSFAAELTWNSTAYDRMHAGLKTFAENSECMSTFLYHKILGHEPELPPRPPPAPTAYQAPNMPVPNHSQLSAIDAALSRPFTLIQVCLHLHSLSLLTGL
jgi:regulator of nonsense transcripts 1